MKKYRSISIPQKTGEKFDLYYKQKDKEVKGSSEQNLYEMIEKPEKKKEKGEENEFPNNRTLQIVNFERAVEEKKLKK